MGYDGRRSDTAALLNDGFDPVGREHFERGALRDIRQGVRVFAHEQRARDPLAAAVFANGLGDGKDMGFGERAVGTGAAVTAGSEADQLRGIGGIGLAIEIFALEPGRRRSVCLRVRVCLPGG